MALDFTSALYLGLRHESGSSTWSELTTGIPAALFRSRATTAAESAFAALVGCERAVALTSTLHALVDLFGQVRAPAAVLYDQGTYPVARWAMERAQLRGVQVLPFRHHDPAALKRRLGRLGRRARPWVVADGFCPGCGRVAPLDAYAELARSAGGQLLVDDTQAIGVLGRGGSGSLPRDVSREGVLLVASLSKAFGAPLAMLAGTREAIARFKARSDTLVHCSPPSEPHVLAAARALSINTRIGESLRAKLVRRVRTFRQALRRRGLAPRGGWFPIQRVPVAGVPRAIALRDALARRGIRVTVVRSRCACEISLTFIVTVEHGEAALETAAAALVAGLEVPSTLEA